MDGDFQISVMDVGLKLMLFGMVMSNGFKMFDIWVCMCVYVCMYFIVY